MSAATHDPIGTLWTPPVRNQDDASIRDESARKRPKLRAAASPVALRGSPAELDREFVVNPGLALEHCKPQAAAELLPLVYEELRRLAAHRMAQESPDQTLQPTALVHEAYLRLVKGNAAKRWNGRGHFFGAAAEAMRRILIEDARRKHRDKRGGGMRRVPLDQEDFAVAAPPDQLLALDRALEQLAASDDAAAILVKLHCFAGFSIEQAGAVLELSRAGAYRLWSYARAWLHCALQGTDA